MKKDTTVHIEMRAAGLTLKLRDALGLGDDDELPEVGSDEWNKRLGWWLTTEGLKQLGIEVTVAWANPHHDPDTIPMFEDLAPDPYVSYEVKAS